MFKIGDKVKITDKYPVVEDRGLIGVISKVWDDSFPYPYSLEESETLSYQCEDGLLVLENEIELLT